MFKAHILCVSLNSRLESHTEEDRYGAVPPDGPRQFRWGRIPGGKKTKRVPHRPGS